MPKWTIIRNKDNLSAEDRRDGHNFLFLDPPSPLF